ncbi:hypothetical protein [Rhodocista pekingensis]|uniref:Uncharacterized protein n=1 Tax=Rhodocista pekingensis TaxID=201185 RepID=A0ABW2KTV6_9PROT
MRDRPTPDPSSDLPPDLSPGLLPAALARLLPVGCRHVAAFIEAGPASDADAGMPDARAFKDWCAAGKAGVALLDALVRLSQRVAPEAVPLAGAPSPDGPSPDGPSPDSPPAEGSPDTPAESPAAAGPEQPGGLAGLLAESRAEIAAWRARRAEPTDPASAAPDPDPAGPDPPDTS